MLIYLLHTHKFSYLFTHLFIYLFICLSMQVVKAERRALAAYPVCLFFAAITWMIMIRTSSG